MNDVSILEFLLYTFIVAAVFMIVTICIERLDEMSKEEKDFFEDENCGHCLHHKNDDGCWVCNNPDSDSYGCYTEYKDVCNDFEERRPRSRFSVEVARNKFKK